MAPVEPTGLSLKEHGLALIEAHAADFLKVMRGLAHAIDQRRGLVSSDDLRELADSLSLTAPHQNAYGAIFCEPGWVVVGRKKSTIPSNHYREIRVWSYRPGGVC